MCADAFDDDFARSRVRWYDFPALLFLHRPVRCRLCDERSYKFRFGAGKSPFKNLWSHYAILIGCLGIGYCFLPPAADSPSTGRITSTAMKPELPPAKPRAQETKEK